VSLHELPQELVHHIVGCTVAHASLGSRYCILRALCRTSRGLGAAATEFLYEHLDVADRDSAELLVRTLDSERGTTGTMAGRVGRWVRCVTFGGLNAEDFILWPDGTFVGRVMARLARSGASRLHEASLMQLTVDPVALNTLGGRPHAGELNG